MAVDGHTEENIVGKACYALVGVFVELATMEPNELASARALMVVKERSF